MLPIGMLIRKRRRTPAFLIFLFLAAFTGCGADRVIPNSEINPVNTTPSPKGTYSLTVSGSAAGVTHSAGVTLIVN
jgi:hypothetical protein